MWVSSSSSCSRRHCCECEWTAGFGFIYDGGLIQWLRFKYFPKNLTRDNDEVGQDGTEGLTRVEGGQRHMRPIWRMDCIWGEYFNTNCSPLQREAGFIGVDGPVVMSVWPWVSHLQQSPVSTVWDHIHRNNNGLSARSVCIMKTMFTSEALRYSAPTFSSIHTAIIAFLHSSPTKEKDARVRRKSTGEISPPFFGALPLMDPPGVRPTLLSAPRLKYDFKPSSNPKSFHFSAPRLRLKASLLFLLH